MALIKSNYFPANLLPVNFPSPKNTKHRVYVHDVGMVFRGIGIHTDEELAALDQRLVESMVSEIRREILAINHG